MSQNLYIKPVGGLANRLRVIASGVRLAKEKGALCVVLWERNPDLNASFSSLFAVPAQFRVIELQPGFQLMGMKPTYFPDKRPRGLRALLYRISKMAYGLNSELWYDDIASLFDSIRENYQPEKAKDLQDLNKRILPDLKKLIENLDSSGAYISTSWELDGKDEFEIDLQPSQEVNTLLKNVELTSPCIGVHIRRTDNTWSREHSGLEKFIEKMKAALSGDSNLKFFIATDDPDSVEELEQYFGEQIIYAPPPALDRSDPLAIKYALIDMLRLAKCDRIFGSYLSSFSDIASKIGNKPLEIVT